VALRHHVEKLVGGEKLKPVRQIVYLGAKIINVVKLKIWQALIPFSHVMIRNRFHRMLPTNWN
jgi:hypothetical protein